MSIKKMDFADGMYTVIYDNGKLTALRYGEPWQDLIGNKLVYFMLMEAMALKAQNAALSDALNLALRCHGQMLLSDPPQEAWKYHRVDEVARAALATQEVKP